MTTIDATVSIVTQAQAVHQAQQLATCEAQTLAYFEANPLQDEQTAAIIAEAVKGWAKEWDQLEKLRKDTTAPINEAKRRVDALFKPGLDALAELRTRAGKILGTWEVTKSRLRAEALAVAAKAVQQPEQRELATLALNVVNAPTQKTGVTVRARWVARITNMRELPQRFLMQVPDEAAIGKYVDSYEAHQIPDPVPGLVFELVGDVTRVSRK